VNRFLTTPGSVAAAASRKITQQALAQVHFIELVTVAQFCIFFAGCRDRTAFRLDVETALIAGLRPKQALSNLAKACKSPTLKSGWGFCRCGVYSRPPLGSFKVEVQGSTSVSWLMRISVMVVSLLCNPVLV